MEGPDLREGRRRPLRGRGLVREREGVYHCGRLDTIGRADAGPDTTTQPRSDFGTDVTADEFAGTVDSAVAFTDNGT